MNTRSKFFVLAASGLAVIGLSSMSARADIACSGDTCWHVHEAYHYPSGVHVEVHPDTWHWGPSEHFVVKEHPGRGYWGEGEWHEF